jgi:hypothetical protein
MLVGVSEEQTELVATRVLRWVEQALHVKVAIIAQAVEVQGEGKTMGSAELVQMMAQMVEMVGMV